ncbi:hypothetical protein H5410_061547, partial [Solanum commersonii]
TYFQCKLHGRRTIQVEDFGRVHAIVYENACNFFRWRDREDVDIRSRFIILRLTKRIKELEIYDESHIKRSNKWVMKEKKTKCCNNWKVIFVLIVVVLFLFLSITKKKNIVEDGKFLCIKCSNVATYYACGATYESNIATYHPSVVTCDSNVATDDPCVATYETNVVTYDLYVATNDFSVATYASNVATYHPYVARFDHMRHMLLQMTHMTYVLLQMTYMLLQMPQMLQHITLCRNI